ncbi:MAG: DNA-binding HxlR family transcriptional regulator [Halobacteriales archaeon]|jgi:DNA-binding HxlR family transcriptional regulator
MTETDEAVVVDRLPADEALDLVGHEIRLDILMALDEADGRVTFSDLRETVGTRDSGQFNYHLDKLRDRFVERSDDGYALADAGRRLTGAIKTGGFTKALEADPVPVAGECFNCGGDLEAQFRDLNVLVTCTECEIDVTEPKVPPGVLQGYHPEEVPDVLDRWVKRSLYTADFGFCEYCGGRMERSLVRTDPDEDFGGEDHEIEARANYECDRCGYQFGGVLTFVLLAHPTVVAFHHDHGVDVREKRFWTYDWLARGLSTVTNEDPLRVETSITLDDETLTVVVDESVAVLEERRE